MFGKSSYYGLLAAMLCIDQKEGWALEPTPVGLTKWKHLANAVWVWKVRRLGLVSTWMENQQGILEPKTI